ncbi:MAG: OadG family transporter subunit [Pseudomonadota bacterium]
MQLGFELALMGMATVFIFLIFLIFLTTLMSRSIMALEKKIALAEETNAVLSDGTEHLSGKILTSIIKAAILQHQLKYK